MATGHKGDMELSPDIFSVNLGELLPRSQAHDAWRPDAQLASCVSETHCDFHNDLISISQAWCYLQQETCQKCLSLASHILQRCQTFGFYKRLIRFGL